MKNGIEAVTYKGEKLGEINHDKKTYTSLRTRTHLLKKLEDGFEIPVNLLDYLQECKITNIIIYYENKDVFITTVDKLVYNGEDVYIEGDAQLRLPLEYWKKETMDETQEKL